MSITPQAIKDQEFQIKFRGYDAIEVKAYLELLAEEFFELHELRRKQEDDYAELFEENQNLIKEKDSLLEEEKELEERSAESQQQFAEKDEVIQGLEEKVAELAKQLEQSEQEKMIQQEAWEKQETELREEIALLSEKVSSEQELANTSSTETEKLKAQIGLLEAQVSELKNEEIDFKSTIIAAQKFADEMKAKSMEEAEQLLAQAQEDVETFKRESEEELAHLPAEIERLRKKRIQVREDLKALLQTYLEQVEIVDDVAESDNDEDLSDLFQSISLNGEDVDPAGLDKAGVE